SGGMGLTTGQQQADVPGSARGGPEVFSEIRLSTRSTPHRGEGGLYEPQERNGAAAGARRRCAWSHGSEPGGQWFARAAQGRKPAAGLTRAVLQGVRDTEPDARCATGVPVL